MPSQSSGILDPRPAPHSVHAPASSSPVPPPPPPQPRVPSPSPVTSCAPPPNHSPPSLHGVSQPLHGDLNTHAAQNSNLAAVLNAVDNDNLFRFSSTGSGPSSMGRSRKRPRLNSPRSLKPQNVTKPNPTSVILPHPHLPETAPSQFPPPPPPHGLSSSPTPSFLAPILSASLPPCLPITPQSASLPPSDFPSISPAAPTLDQEVLATVNVGSALGFQLDDSVPKIVEIINGERGDYFAS